MSRTNSGNSSNYIESNSIKPVNEAVQEYRIIEDGALAHHLQEREIEYHLALNVQQRKTVMEDIKAAKMLQDEEDHKARIFTIDQQEQIKEEDERLAEIVQSELIENQIKEDEEKREGETHDSEIALRMRERDKYDERRREERDRKLAQQMANVDISEERKKQLSDEDLAWKLQEEERRKLKHKKQNKEHLKAVIEMQDEELAKYIHEKEMEEAEMMRRHEHGDKRSRKSRLKSHPEEAHSSYSHSPGGARSLMKEEIEPPLPPRQVHHSHHGSRSNRHRKGAPSRDEELDLEYRPLSPHQHKKLSRKDGKSGHVPQRPPPPRSGQEYSCDESELMRSRSKEKLSHRDDDPPYEISRRELPRPNTSRPSSSHSNGSSSPRQSQRRSSQDLLESRSRSRSSRTDLDRNPDEEEANPWARFPNSSPNHHTNPPSDDLSYGDGLKRLEAQESWSQHPNPRHEKKKKSGKGDCKQQ